MAPMRKQHIKTSFDFKCDDKCHLYDYKRHLYDDKCHNFMLLKKTHIKTTSRYISGYRLPNSNNSFFAQLHSRLNKQIVTETAIQNQTFFSLKQYKPFVLCYKRHVWPTQVTHKVDTVDSFTSYLQLDHLLTRHKTTLSIFI